MSAQSRPTLLLTRPASAAARFADQARARWPGLPVVISPLMAPEFLSPALPDHWDGVLFTSETGVAGLARLTDRRGPALCVGPRTAQVAAAAGWSATALGGNAEAMLATLGQTPRPGQWLHARGEDAAGALAARLSAAGAMQVQEIVVYAQRPRALSPEALRLLSGAGPVIVAVFSPRSARLFVEQWAGAGADLQAVAISQAAGAALAGCCRVVVADRPDSQGMLVALGQVLGEFGQAGLDAAQDCGA